MKRLERLTSLISFLQSKSYVKIDDICEKFQITERTVYRDLKSLGEIGVPISFEKDRGYFVLDKHFLAPVSFTIEEAKSFVFVNALAKKYTDEETYKNFESALEKIKNKLKEHQLEDIEALESNVRAYINPKYSTKYLKLIEQACSMKQVLEIKYADFNDKETTREVEPIGISFYSQTWHLIAFCRLRKDYRDFSILRVKEVNLTGETMNEERLDLDGYIKKIELAQEY